MADINVERRDSAPWWLWALGLIIVGLLAFWLATAFGGDEEIATEDPAAYPVETVPALPEESAPLAVAPAVQEYIDTCGPARSEAMGLDHQYTSSCVNTLVWALDAATSQQATAAGMVQEEMTAAREAASNLQESAAREEEHAQMTREAFTSIVAVFERLQAQSYPALEGQVSQLSQAAESVQPAQPLLDQRENVQKFFSTASEALATVGHAGEAVGV